MDRLFRAARRVAVAFLLVLGVVALLPAPVRDAVPQGLIGAAVLVLGGLGARRGVRGPR
ncbi:hypothetical protein [Streptomyces sp. A1136]|uniref:hypothetical protein n=1 Tax=Streptomyces sp. A1136 TaxID=2563102 RepID=UPI001446EF80|nr:hypothetical protein [Streptomyces sp. A1136]